jgi:mycofactocin biosynthetic radical S-adenosylmethionine protein MftC
METALHSLEVGSHARAGQQSWFIRRPDYDEQREGLALQIWGDEGYWHIVDRETQELLEVVSQPTTLKTLLTRKPAWARQKDLVASTLQSVSHGLTQAAKPIPPQIENISINLTTACNLHCATCYVPARDRGSRKLDAAAAIAFLEKLGNHLSPRATISLLGGEPFLHPSGVLALAGWAQKHGHTCNVSTNGTVPLTNLARQIRKAGLHVQVSIDGASAQANDALRGAGTFEKALRTAKELISAGVHTTLCMVACRENQAEIADYLRLAQALGANEARIIPLKRLGNARNDGPTPASQLGIVQAVAAELERDPSLEKLCQSDLYAILRSLVKEGSRRQSCGSGTQTLLLQADGSVYPCINNTQTHARLGTADYDTAAILRNGARWGNELSVENARHPCHPCAVKRWCLAGCPGETIQREGSLKSPHWNCADLKGAITCMMWRSSNGAKAGRAGRTLI